MLKYNLLPNPQILGKFRVNFPPAGNSWAVKLKELKIVNPQYLWMGWNNKECEESFRAEKAPFREFEVAFSNLDNTDWKSTLYISHSYLSLLSYIFYPLYFSFWLCALNHEKFILLQVEIKPSRKGGNRRKEFTLIQYVFIWHNKAFLLIFESAKSGQFR